MLKKTEHALIKENRLIWLHLADTVIFIINKHRNNLSG